MSDRSQTLTRTRCPGCGTVFRVTSEQLRLKAGKVRCGHCQLVFNAFDHLLADIPAEPTPVVVSVDVAVDALPEAKTPTEALASRHEPSLGGLAPEPPVLPPEPPGNPPANPDETPEESAQAAREAGLAALRALDDRPGFDRWSAGTLATGGAHFAETHAEGPRWPYVLMSALLLVALIAQLSYHFRTELSLRLPSSTSVFGLFAIDVPLPDRKSVV